MDDDIFKWNFLESSNVICRTLYLQQCPPFQQVAPSATTFVAYDCTMGVLLRVIPWSSKDCKQ